MAPIATNLKSIAFKNEDHFFSIKLLTFEKLHVSQGRAPQLTVIFFTTK